jgi:hypothetical protein
VIPRKPHRWTTIQGRVVGTGLAEFASPCAVLGQPGGRCSCSGILPDQTGSGAAFYRSQANIRFLAQNLKLYEM